MCVLGGIHGNFRGGGEFVFLEAANATYQLNAQSLRTRPEETVGGSAICIERSRFFNAYSQDFYGPPNEPLVFFDLEQFGPTGPTAVARSAGNVGSFLSLAGISGQFEGLSTTAFISDQPTLTAPGEVKFKIDTSSTGQFLKVRLLGDGLALRPGRTRQELSLETRAATPPPGSPFEGVAYSTQTRVGDSQNEFCFLTSIAGEFLTRQDSVSLRVDGSSWVLRWSASAPFLAPYRTKQVFARCVKYDQR